MRLQELRGSPCSCISLNFELDDNAIAVTKITSQFTKSQDFRGTIILLLLLHTGLHLGISN